MAGHVILAAAMPRLLAVAAGTALAALAAIRLSFRPRQDWLGRRRRP